MEEMHKARYGEGQGAPMPSQSEPLPPTHHMFTQPISSLNHVFWDFCGGFIT